MKAILSALRDDPAKAWARPDPGLDSNRLVLLVSVAALTLVAIATRVPTLGDGYSAPDTEHYLAVAQSIFDGGYPDNLRPPIYSLLLSVLESAGADPVTAVVLFQNCIGMLLPAVVLLIAWRLFSPAVGLLSGLLTAASPLMLITEQLALAEFLFGVSVLVATALLTEAALQLRAGKMPWRWLVASGVMFGLATLVRGNGLIGLVAIPLALALTDGRFRSASRASVIALGAMALTVLPWCVHNQIKFDDPSISRIDGVSLYARAITWDEVPPNPETRDGQLAFSIYSTVDPNAPRTSQPTLAVFNALVADGKTPGEAGSAMGELARDAVWRYPDIYLEETWPIFDRYRTFYDPRSLGPAPETDHIAITRTYFRDLKASASSMPAAAQPQPDGVPGDSAWSRAPWQVAQVFTRILYLITIGGAIILLLPFLGSSRMRAAATVFITVLLLAVVGSSLTGTFQPRYDVMYAPIVWILLAAGLGLVIQIIDQAIQKRPWQRKLRSG